MSAFHWVLNNADGAALRSTDPFESKEDAEAWMGEHWAELLDEGAETVSLMSDEHALYEMGLRES
ncbi:MAG TPA: hypothetical protein VE174_12745 [Actinomycetota bacterium]|nr:hypothetical protein [Actinomycetota bacterium]